MENPIQDISKQHFAGVIRNLIFHLLFFLYLWLVIDTSLIYHGGGLISDFPVFYRGWTFFQETALHPGGMIEYISAFLSQFFYYSWAGAIIISMQSWLLCISTGAIIDRMNFPHLRFIRFLPPILILIVCTQYAFFFGVITALLAAMIFVCFYLKLSSESLRFNSILFLVLSVILYTIGAGAYLFFAVLCVIYELFFTRRWRLGSLFLVSALVVPFVEGVLLFGMSIYDAFVYLLPFHWLIVGFQNRRIPLVLIYILYLFLPVVGFVFGSWKILINKTMLQVNISSYSKKPVLKWCVETMALCLIAGGSIYFSYDRGLRTQLKVDYYSYHKNFPKVIETARRYPDSDFTVFSANRALYHMGRFSQELFSFPQLPTALFLSTEKAPLLFWRKFDIYIDLGLMNMAEHMLIEAIAEVDERPQLLKRLVLVNLVKDDLVQARVYLNKLAKTFFYADWANDYLSRINADPSLSTDTEVQHLRSLRVKKDFECGSAGLEFTLLSLLESNKKNRMAFEYLMALYLESRMTDKFAANLWRLDDVGFKKLPRHYEEAILVHSNVTGKRIRLQSHRVSPETSQRFDAFDKILTRHKRNRQAAQQDLAKLDKNSYFFYYLYMVPDKK